MDGFTYLMIIIAIIAAIVTVKKELKKKANLENKTINPKQESNVITIDEQQIKERYNDYPYTKKSLLTKNENDFYYKIKSDVYNMGYHILVKIRLADLVEPKKGLDNSDYMSKFGKIKAKHIDFAIVADDMRILCLIELDDSSHNSKSRIERDMFINDILYKTGYTLLRVYNNNEGKEKILNFLNSALTKEANKT